VTSAEAARVHEFRDSSQDHHTPEAKAQAGFKFFLKVADLWGLSGEERCNLLGLSAKSTYHHWQKNGITRPSMDLIDRLSYILGIHESVMEAFPDDHGGVQWLRRPNRSRLLEGEAPLGRMLRGHMNDLRVVRDYLDGAAEVWS